VLLAAAAVGLAAVVAGAVFFSTRGAGSGAKEVQPDNVAVIDPETNEIVGEVPVGSKPGPVAKGAGSIWVGNLHDRTITRISLVRRIRTATISLNDRTPTGLGFGAGALWVAHGLRGQLSRVDPRSNRVVKTIGVADPGSSRGTLAVGAGSVWVAFGDSTFARVNPKPLRIAGATFAGDSPAGVVVGAGSVWVVNSGDATVSRFSPRSYEGGAIGRPIRVGRKPGGITYGEGAVWVTDTADDAVTRIDPFTNFTSTIRVGAGPTAVTAGGGLVWVANTAGRSISRIDPVSNEVTGTIKIGSAPAGIVFDGGSVWVAVQAP